MSGSTKSGSVGPDYDVGIGADELLADFAEDAAQYGEKFEYAREKWQESLNYAEPFHDARFWMLEAIGGRRAYSKTIAKLQPGGRFRNDDDTVNVRGLLRWLSNRSEETNEARHGDYAKTRGSSEAHSAYSSIISTVRSDYGVGWPRLDDLGGTALECDLP